jgi:hypothetical protein
MPGADPRLDDDRLEPEVAGLISRRAEVMRGTPRRWRCRRSSSNEKPWKPRNSWDDGDSSSAVRSALVAMRQWSSRPASAELASTSASLAVVEADDGLVLPTSMTSSIRRSPLPRE